jgi:hypothetical protein
MRLSIALPGASLAEDDEQSPRRRGGRCARTVRGREEY